MVTRSFLEIIDKHGWHVMSVAPRLDSTIRVVSYSTEICARFSHPEIIVLGLDGDTGIAIVNEIGKAVKAGRKFELDTDYDDVFDEHLSADSAPFT